MIVEICDCETDGLLPTMTRMWTLQVGRAGTEEVTIYADQPGFPPLKEGMERLKKADRLVFHNGMGFDIHAVNKVFPGAIQVGQIWDTLVAARLLNPEEKLNSLDDWGQRLECLKGKYTGDFQSFTEELVTYARQDIVVTRKLYELLEPQLRDWGQSVWIENMTAYVIALQEQNGFRLNLEKAQALEADLRGELAQIEAELQEIFPPIWVPKKTKGTALFIPKVGTPTGKGETVKDAPFTRVTYQMFNAASRTQIAQRFIRKYRWKPTKFTDKGAPAIDEEVVSGLPFPEAKAILRYLRVEKQLGQLVDGKNGWLKLVKPDGRVYGRVNPNGAGTGRMSHFKPNMAQVDKKDLRMRECWEARPGWKLVGCDAEGLEARMLGHYLARFDGGSFSDRVVNGDKSKGTDVHTVNLNALKRVLMAGTSWIGLASRDGAKTYLYAMMYGAGDPKLGKTIVDDMREKGIAIPKGINLRRLGQESKKKLAKGMVGIDKLVEAVKKKAKEVGYLIGLDGRQIFVRSEHSAFNFLLQGGGAIVMKMALIIFHFELAPSNGWVYWRDFAYCANVHDEVQTECKPEIAEDLGKTFAQAIAMAGERLNVRCPLAGAFDIGNNWKDTH